MAGAAGAGAASRVLSSSAAERLRAGGLRGCLPAASAALSSAWHFSHLAVFRADPRPMRPNRCLPLSTTPPRPLPQWEMVVPGPGETYRAEPLKVALEKLDTIWDGLFDYSGVSQAWKMQAEARRGRSCCGWVGGWACVQGRHPAAQGCILLYCYALHRTGAVHGRAERTCSRAGASHWPATHAHATSSFTRPSSRPPPPRCAQQQGTASATLNSMGSALGALGRRLPGGGKSKKQAPEVAAPPPAAVSAPTKAPSAAKAPDAGKKGGLGKRLKHIFH